MKFLAVFDDKYTEGECVENTSSMSLYIATVQPCISGTAGSCDVLDDQLTNFVKREYKDLGPAEQFTVFAFIKAYQNRVKMPHRFAEEKRRLIFLIGDLYRQVYSLTGMPAKESAIIKLVNLSRLIRGSGTRISEIRAVLQDDRIGSVRVMGTMPQITLKGLRNADVVITPGQLPEEVKDILKMTKYRNGLSYFDYIKANVNLLYFTPSVDRRITIMKRNDVGTAEELTRTCIVDTSNEGIMWDSDWPAWDLAATVVTEAAHIDWYYQKNGDPFMLDYVPNEKAALIIQRDFLQNLLFANKGTLSNTEAYDVRETLKTASEQIFLLESKQRYMAKPLGIKLP